MANEITLNETSLIHLLDSIYHADLDLTAAFDTIDHNILLNRLTFSFGIMGSSHNWLMSHLSQQVVFIDSSSFILPSSHDVPQGSVLGYIFFAIYVSPIAFIASSHDINSNLLSHQAPIALPI